MILNKKLLQTQQDVDQYVTETEKVADKVCDEETAMELFRRVDQLHYVSKSFFVPNIVLAWEEMALSYIESDKAIFDCVHYPHIQDAYAEGIETFKSLENFVLKGELKEEHLFRMVQAFNRGLSTFNKYCREYDRIGFSEYCFTNHDLQQHFKKWESELDV